MNERTCLAIILAAGQGTRMKSALPKVMHTIGGLTLIGHVAARMAAIPDAKLALVTGKGQEPVADAVRKISHTATVHIQDQQHGTAHAVLAARSAIAEGYDDIIVVFGDTPFVTSETITRLRTGIAEGAVVTVASMEPDDPAAYGRMITDGENLLAIREYRDCTDEERKITLCNGGLMAIDGAIALELLAQIGNDNDQNEYYLPVVVEVAVRAGHRAGWVAVAEAEMLGINDRAQLADAECRFQTARRQQALADGVGMIAPETVYFSHDTQLAADVMVEPNVIFAPGVRVESGATIRAFSHLEG
ncbi:MAG: NTP transferase domain-containing protein, partial [Alphaproteobacteria bacterium]